jgi:hypothetical protein
LPRTEKRTLRILTVLIEKRDDRRAKPFGGGALVSPGEPGERERASPHG